MNIRQKLASWPVSLKSLTWACLLLIGVPLLFSIICGDIYRANVVNNIPLVIYDADNTSSSRSIVEAYKSADKFTLVGQAASLEEMEEYLQDGTAYTSVYIPPHFSKNIKMGTPTALAVAINSSNVVIGNNALAAHNELGMSLLINVGQKLIEGTGQPANQAFDTAYPVQLSTRIIDNPTNNYSNFMLLGIVANGIQIGILLAVTLVIFNHYRRAQKEGSCASSTFWGASFIGFIILSTIAALVSIYVTQISFGVPMRAPFWQLGLLTFAFCTFITSLSYLFTVIYPSEISALQLPLIYIMPGLLYSGLSWPNKWMDSFPAFLSAIMPLTYYGIPLRDLSVRGHSFLFSSSLTIMFVSSVVIMLIATLLLVLRQKHYAKKHGSNNHRTNTHDTNTYDTNTHDAETQPQTQGVKP